MEEKPLILSEKEHEKFQKNLEKAWSLYMFHFKVWRGEMKRIQKNYNGFGLELPSLCVEIDNLFENFVDVEIKKAKNKKYQKYLTIMFKEED